MHLLSQMARLPSFLRLNSIPWGYITFSLSADGHLGCFHVLGIINRATIYCFRTSLVAQEDPLEKEMATHSSTLAWKIPWTEEHGRLQSMGLQRVIHDSVTSLSFPPWSWESRYFYDIVSSFSLDIFPAVELLDHMVVLFSVFWGNVILFFIVAAEVHQRRQWQPTPVLLPRKSHGQRSLVGCSPWGREVVFVTTGHFSSLTLLNNFTFTFNFHALEKEMQSTPVFLPGESQGWRSLVGCRLWGCTESDTTEGT